MQRFIENTKARLKDEPLMLLATTIDWDVIESKMQSEHWREFFRRTGRQPYSYRSMIRALLLGRWHNLSYQKLERALRVRMDFLLFCDFRPDQKLPDACTLNRFMKRLSGGAFESIADEIELQLQSKGFWLRPAASALEDLYLVLRRSE